jgi:N-ethylmaleimide reductase
VSSPLFQPLTLGDLTLANRVLMAPLTRSRALQPGDVPSALTAEYYRQRASAGLIIGEAVAVSPHGKGYAFTPGLYSDEQVAGWRVVTDEVHRARGLMFAQLLHAGRISHVELLPGGRAPAAPSAIRARAQSFVPAGPVPCSEPQALDLDGIADIVEQFRTSARRAMEAGFDGVEIHGAYGYLLDQFTRDGSNRRTDAYGGSMANRARLPLEVTRAVAEVWGPSRVGYRISPCNTFNDIADSDPAATFGHLAEQLARLGLAYIHVAESDDRQGGREEQTPAVVRSAFAGTYIASSGYQADTAAERIAQGRADAVAFGALFIANPDLPERFRRGAALNIPDPSTYYGGGARGYTDYPPLPAGTDAEADPRT